MKQIALLLLASTSVLVAQTLPRGPYIQNASPTAMSVLWRTTSATYTRVFYGTDPANLTQNEASLAASDHEVRITGLQPATKYFYAIEVDGTRVAEGPDYYFETQPLSGSTGPVRFWVIGDAGTGNINQQRVRNAFYKYQETNQIDFWMMLGDNAYSTGRDTEYQNAVFNMYPQLLRNKVVWSCLGNHDSGFLTNNTPVPYDSIFAFPTGGESGGVASGTERYYSFNHGPIHFISIDAMTSSRLSGGDMAQWLAADLQANTLPWVVSFWHHPPYDKGTHDSDFEDEQIEMRQHIVPILESHGVDLVLGGHSHVYQRTHLLDNHLGESWTFDPASHVKQPGDGDTGGNGAYVKPTLAQAPHQGTVYIVCGNSGQIGGFGDPHPANLVNLDGAGSLVFEVSGQQLSGKFLRDIASPTAPLVFEDGFTIFKGANPPPPPTVPFTAPAAPVFLPIASNRVLVAWQDTNGGETGYELDRIVYHQHPARLANLAANATCAELVLAPFASIAVKVSSVKGSERRTSPSADFSQPGVVAAVSELTKWQFCNFATTSQAGTASLTADSDGDGFNNLLEYACESHPRQAASAPSLLAQMANGRLNLSFQRAARPDLLYEVQFTSSLAANDWTTGFSSSGAQNVQGMVTGHDPLLISPERRFARLKITAL